MKKYTLAEVVQLSLESDEVLYFEWYKQGVFINIEETGLAYLSEEIGFLPVGPDWVPVVEMNFVDAIRTGKPISDGTSRQWRTPFEVVSHIVNGNLRIETMADTWFVREEEEHELD